MVEIIMKIIKSEGPLRVTPPKNKKNKKLRERAGAVGAVEVHKQSCGICSLDEYAR